MTDGYFWNEIAALFGVHKNKKERTDSGIPSFLRSRPSFCLLRTARGPGAGRFPIATAVA